MKSERHLRVAESTASVPPDLAVAIHEPSLDGRDPLSSIDESLMYDLHDGPSQLFVVLNLLAQRFLEELPSDSRWAQRIARFAELSEEGKWQMDQIARGLGTRPAVKGGLPRALRELCRRFQSDSGIVTRLLIKGNPQNLDDAKAEALHRVAHLALVNSWKHSRCGLVSIDLRHEPDATELRVTDDGIGLGQRWETRRCRLGFASMRRTIEAVGGQFRAKRKSPRGVQVLARVPEGSPE